MQRAEPTATDPSGFSLAELEDVAREAGIDPAMVRRAASQLEVSRTKGLGDALAGAPTTIRLEVELPGEYPTERFDEIVPIVQAASAWQGHAGVVGRTLTWTSRADSNTSSRQVFVSVGSGHTLVRIEERLGGFAGGLFGGLIGGVGGGVGAGVGGGVGAAIGSTLFGIGFPILMIGGSYLAARAIFASIVNRETVKLQALLDQIAAHAESVIETSTPLPPESE
jgi:hypothetical protein